MPPLTLSAPIPRDSDFREVREHISRLEAERGRRAAALVSLRQRLVLALEALEQSAQTELEMEVVWSPEQVRLGERRMAELEARVNELETEDSRNQQEGEKLMAKLKLLWNRLEVSWIPPGPVLETLSYRFNRTPTGALRKYQFYQRFQFVRRFAGGVVVSRCRSPGHCLVVRC